MNRVVSVALTPFFIALGVQIGGSIIGAIPSVVTNGRLMKAIYDLCQQLKIWSVAIAIGGTFPAIELLQAGIFQRSLGLLLKEFIVILSALTGAFAAEWIIGTITGGRG